MDALCNNNIKDFFQALPPKIPNGGLTAVTYVRFANEFLAFSLSPHELYTASTGPDL